MYEYVLQDILHSFISLKMLHLSLDPMHRAIHGFVSHALSLPQYEFLW